MTATPQVALVTGASSGIGKVRERDIQVVRVQPGPTDSPFDANMAQADSPLPVYARQRRVCDDVMAESMRVSVLRRVAPAWAFDRSVRKLNRMVG
ncbi:hypothetical protein ACIRG5_44360 [Lentzea sp. NPDC102401]|uniref:hypothetical protein n=1 Tax=Lentzea sp. NPDC102401 TaxID=3364128 RepID=UPI0037F63828